MRIKIFILFALIVIGNSCKNEKQLVLPVEKVYIFQVNDLVDDFSNPDFMRILGMIEIEKDFTAKITSIGNDSLLYYSEVPLSDTIKNIFLELIREYSTDSIYYKEPSSWENLNTFAIEISDNRYARIGPNLPEKLEPIAKLLFTCNKDYGQFVQNQDSLKSYLDRFKRLVIMPLPPLPLKATVAFKPPVFDEK